VKATPNSGVSSTVAGTVSTKVSAKPTKLKSGSYAAALFKT
jgi:hypothetical protein